MSADKWEAGRAKLPKVVALLTRRTLIIPASTLVADFAWYSWVDFVTHPRLIHFVVLHFHAFPVNVISSAVSDFLELTSCRASHLV